MTEESEMVRRHFESGLKAYIEKKYETAIVHFDKAIELDPRYPGNYINRGLVRKALGSWEQALEDFSKAIDIDPDYAGAYFNSGMLHWHKGQQQKAVENWKMVLSLAPDHPAVATVLQHLQDLNNN